MSELEKYEELIRQKFAEKEFIFNEENWEKAEKVLDLSKKSKKLFWWSSIFLIGLITGIGLMFILSKEDYHFVNTSKNQSNDSKTIEKNSLHNENGTILPGKNSTDEIQLNKKGTELNLNTNEKSSSMTADNNTVNEKNNAYQTTQVTNSHLEKNTPFSVSSESNQNLSPKKRKDKAGNDAGLYSEDNTLLKSDENAGGQDLTRSHGAGSSTQKKIKKIKSANSLNNSTTQTASAEKELIASKTTKKEIELATKERKTQQNLVPLTKKGVKKPSANQKGIIVTDSSASDEVLDTMALEEIDQKRLAVADSVSDSVKLEIKKPEATDSIQAKADSSLSENKALQSLPMDGLASITLVTLDAGIHAQIGWKYEDTIEGRGITPIIGVGINHWFNQKWSLCAGLQYGSIAYLKASSKKLTSTTYGFGSTTTETMIKPGILHYLVIPLMIQYHFNEKNAVFAGGNMAILLNRKNKVELKYTQVTPGKPAELSEQTSGNYYASSFNPMDATLCVGYRRKISSHFTVMAIASYGMLDIKKDVFFSQNKLERNSGLKLVFSYTLFDF